MMKKYQYILVGIIIGIVLGLSATSILQSVSVFVTTVKPTKTQSFYDEAMMATNDIISKKFLHCGESWITQRLSGGYYWLWEFRNINPDIKTNVVSAADTANGIEWSGDLYWISPTIVRSILFDDAGEWNTLSLINEWGDYNDVVGRIEKINGEWVMGQGSWSYWSLPNGLRCDQLP